jgi:peptidylprolyl isomerase domain and WD repeat-containing protein 1
MTDSEQDASVLGKRGRVGQANDTETVDVPMVDDEDDDVGPMPMSADAANGGVKKKRKGAPRLLSDYLLLDSE